VPEVLLNGNHAAIARWRRRESLRRTRDRRPDLFAAHILDNTDQKLLAEIEATESISSRADGAVRAEEDEGGN
jgi:tRNA (guanine37-N1)-methyltransferase